MIGAILATVGQVLLLCLTLNIVIGTMAGAIILHWWLIKKSEPGEKQNENLSGPAQRVEQ
ncbi:MAG: hypothetical protein R3E95_22485 [Thiolinea sp.]